MGKDCHRCGSPLATPETFCPSCGAPQLFYQPNVDDTAVDDQTRGPLVRDIHWKQALGAAITFAVPIGLLCSSVVPALASLCCLWVVGGTVATIGLYQRRAAAPILIRRVGVRIGAITGILAAAIAAGSNAGDMVFERYVLHGGEAMDKAFQSSMEQGSQIAAQFYAASPAQAQEAMQFWISPDGRSAAMLLTAVMSSLGIVAFSMIGGALGARIFSGRRPRSV